MVRTFYLLCVAVALLASLATAEQLNVYGEPLQECGTEPGSGEGNGCTYRSYDRGAHQVCVTSMPGGFSSSTGQGPWSDAHIGQPWCICIWAYSNVIMQEGNKDEDLPIKCDALPEEVLSSSFSLKKFQDGGPQFLAAIDRMCNTCKAQAPSTEGLSALHSKCVGLKSAAGHKADY